MTLKNAIVGSGRAVRRVRRKSALAAVLVIGLAALTAFEIANLPPHGPAQVMPVARCDSLCCNGESSDRCCFHRSGERRDTPGPTS